MAGAYLKMIWKPGGRDGINLWAWWRNKMKSLIFMTEQLLLFVWSSLVKLWVSREPVCVCVSLWLSGRVMMETLSFLSSWSHSHCEWGPPVGLMRKQASVISSRASLIARLIKNPLAMWETWVWSLGWEVHLEKGKATQSSVLAWRIPWGHKESDMTKRLSLWLSSVTTQ